MDNEALNTNNIQIPYLAHQEILARFERTINRLWIICIVLIIFLVITNSGWLFYEYTKQTNKPEVPTIQEEQSTTEAT